MSAEAEAEAEAVTAAAAEAEAEAGDSETRVAVGLAFMVSADDMIFFAAIARAGGVRGASRVLDVPRSTLSRRLARLEEELGAKLVVRTSRQFALTEIGAAFLERCVAVDEQLREAEELVHRASAVPSGTLRIAASPLVGDELLPPVVEAYLLRWPEARLEVRLSADYVDLRRDGVDIAIRTGPLSDASDLFAVSVGVSVTGVFASQGYLGVHGAPATPYEMGAHACILVGTATSVSWAFRDGDSDVRVPVRGRLRVDSFYMARSAAANGLGITRLPVFFAEPLVSTGALMPVLTDHWPTVPLYAVHAAARPVPAKVRYFLQTLREHFAHTAVAPAQR